MKYELAGVRLKTITWALVLKGAILAGSAQADGAYLSLGCQIVAPGRGDATMGYGTCSDRPHGFASDSAEEPDVRENIKNVIKKVLLGYRIHHVGAIELGIALEPSLAARPPATGF